MKASDLLIASLENEGIDTIFALPGEENLDMMESIRTSNITVHLTRHEQSAVFMAAAHGRLTGQPGVCLTTLGPGATNTMTAVAYAHLGGMPLLLITGQKPIKDRVQGSFQVLDIVEMMTPITKQSSQIIEARHIPTAIRQSFRAALADKPGPVHLELPEDIAAEDTKTVCLPVTEPLPTVAQQSSINLVAERLKTAKRPLVLISSGAARADCGANLLQLIDSQELYFCTTQMGKGVVDEYHPRCLGTAAVSSGDYVHAAIAEADLVLNIGHDLTEKPPYVMTPESCDVVHIDTTPARIDQVYYAQYELIGCIDTNLQMLNKTLEQVIDRRDYFETAKQQVNRHVLSREFAASNPLSPQFLVSVLNGSLPGNTILSLDNGLYKIWFARHFQARFRHQLLLDNALATMGAGLPVAIGAKLAKPDHHMVAVCGDGGFLMNCQELETATRLKLDLVVLVLTDDAYGMIKWKQRNDGLTEYGMDFNSVDLVQFAESFGAQGHKVVVASEVGNQINQCLNAGGVHIIDVPIDYTLVDDDRIGS